MSHRYLCKLFKSIGKLEGYDPSTFRKFQKIRKFLEYTNPVLELRKKLRNV